MKPQSHSSLLGACLMALVAGLAAYSPTVAAGQTFHNVSGTDCAAFNNAQADALERSHVRIYNPATSGRNLWIVCQMQRVLEDLESTVLKPQFYLTAYFGAEAAAGTTVTCIFREFDNQVTHEPGDGQGTTAEPEITNVQSVTVSKVGTVAQTQVGAAIFAIEDLTTQQYWTWTCLLPPGTGINEIDVEQQ